MPVIETQEERPLCPQGPHILKLFNVERKDMPAYENKEATTPRLIWTFESAKVDPETRKPWQIVLFTGTSYGDTRSRLTWLLNLMIPGITKEQAEGLDTDLLIATRYKAQIRHEPAKNNPAKIYALPLYLEALQPSPFAPLEGEVVEVDFPDPFETQ